MEQDCRRKGCFAGTCLKPEEEESVMMVVGEEGRRRRRRRREGDKEGGGKEAGLTLMEIIMLLRVMSFPK